MHKITTLKAIIFDLDGVIINTEHYHALTWQQLADERGWQYNPIIAQQMTGMMRMQSLEKLLEINGVEVSEEEKLYLCEAKNNAYLAFVETMSPADILPGVYALLLQAKSLSLKIGLASSSRNAILLIEKMGLTPFFDAMIDGNHVFSSKPNPEIFLTCAAALKVLPSECIVIEDSLAGIQAAHNAGMFCVAVSPHFQSLADVHVTTLVGLDLQQSWESHRRKDGKLTT